MKGNKQWLNAIPFNLINTFRFSSDHAIFRNMKTIFNLSFLRDITGEGRGGGREEGRTNSERGQLYCFLG